MASKSAKVYGQDAAYADGYFFDQTRAGRNTSRRSERLELPGAAEPAGFPCPSPRSGYEATRARRAEMKSRTPTTCFVAPRMGSCGHPASRHGALNGRGPLLARNKLGPSDCWFGKCKCLGERFLSTLPSPVRKKRKGRGPRSTEAGLLPSRARASNFARIPALSPRARHVATRGLRASESAEASGLRDAPAETLQKFLGKRIGVVRVSPCSEDD